MRQRGFFKFRLLYPLAITVPSFTITQPIGTSPCTYAFFASLIACVMYASMFCEQFLFFLLFVICILFFLLFWFCYFFLFFIGFVFVVCSFFLLFGFCCFTFLCCLILLFLPFSSVSVPVILRKSIISNLQPSSQSFLFLSAFLLTE